MTPSILSVSQLNAMARELLESAFDALWINGELSNVSTPASGHWYFTLKDRNAQVRCAMFRNRNLFARCRPEPGRQVLVKARVSLYEGRGDYQLIVESLEPAGAGDLQRQFEALKLKLQGEGLFDPRHKKPLPAWPDRVGVITSATGAALQDICHVLRRRYPALAVLVVPVAVQGETAARQIADAIQLVNREQAADVLLVGRGGGSIEDLWAFNEEIVARAIFASGIPVVSAVGHETDFTIADFVADVRAPTPSAAAELISPDQDEVLRRLVQFQRQLFRCIHQRRQHWHSALHTLSSRLQHPRHRLQVHAQQLDHLEQRLIQILHKRVMTLENRLAIAQQDLLHRNPMTHIDALHRTLGQLTERLERAVLHRQREQRQQLHHHLQRLNDVSPLNTLQRGYAIVQDDHGTIVRRSAQVASGDTITARLAVGKLTCRIISAES